ncbi:MAG: sigma-54-dependent Fis family transcriptional regulator [Desulfobacter sp.]|nr:MAG: sigma-54-dependent Fis family transcriptional regulator [Desulfobacter sp.]
MKRQAKILIVDDDASILDVLEARLEAAGFEVFKAGNAAGAARILKSRAVDLMVSDVKMPRKSGTDLFREIREGEFQEIRADLPVIFLTAYGTIPDAVDAIKLGAADYISKPFDGRELIAKINEILSSKTGGPKPRTNGRGTPGSGTDEFIWGKSPAMAALYPVIQKVADTPVNVLILGESGVGKERIAALIHRLSNRDSRPYVVVDCGSTPPGTLESELFGHLKGAFTHAVKDKKGLIETADKGTLFLDEIGNISHDMQCRLLRFLEEGKIRQVGAVAEKAVDARVIAATNADLGEAIEAGTFRQDLYYRLKGITLTVPALRERSEDIPELATFFADKYVRSQGLDPVRISTAAMEVLRSHPWPGNIREMKNCIEAGAILCRNSTIRPQDLQLEPVRETAEDRSLGQRGFSIEESEKNTIIRALKETRGVQKTAADLLNISKRAIHYKIKKYGIRPAEYK